MAILHDHHIHTLYSGHSSPDMIVGAIVNQINKTNLKRVVILEHVPEVGRDRDAVLAGKFDRSRRAQIDAIAREIHDWRGQCSARILLGAEVDADPLAEDGSLLLNNLDGVDVVMASTHYLPGGAGVWYEVPSTTPKEKLEPIYERWMAWMMRVAANPKVDIIAHPGVEMAAMGAIEKFEGKVLEDFGKLMMVCEKYDTAFELNEHVRRKIDAEKLKSYENVFGLVKDIGVKISIGSDAHQLDRVGRYDWIQTVVDRFGFGPDDYFHPQPKRG